MSCAYSLVVSKCLPPTTVYADLMLVFNKLWSPFLPFKVIVFSWLPFRNRIACTRNLLSRGVIKDNGTATCSLCGVEEEDVKHLFLSCNVVETIWHSILNLMGLQCMLPQSLGDWFL